MSRGILHLSAVPRWSHRNPVEGGNPFSDGDPRREVRDEATRKARQALERCDAHLAATARVTLDPVVYRARLIDLALRRFDVRAERGLSAAPPGGGGDYRRWLDVYAANWLVYVADPCPRVDAGDELRRRLDAARRRWSDAATAATGPPAR